MPRFVSIGECMVEMAPTGTAGTYAMGFAGDSFNTAWYARQALPSDWQVDYLTAVGTDTLSDRMLAFMDHAGIGTAHVIRRPDRTLGLYLIELDGAERSFSYWRSQSAARMLAEDPAALDAALAGAALVYLTGITLAILDPAGRARLAAALGRARGAGAQVAFDPNLRPGLWPDRRTLRAATTEAAGLADIVLPSFDEEAAQFGDESPGATARRYAAAGAPLVIVKDGPGPVLTLHDGTERSFPVRPVDHVADTTAAGDSFNAGFLAAWLTGAPLDRALAAGAETAARVIAARGALAPAG